MKQIVILFFVLSSVTCFGDDFKDAMIKTAPNVDLAGTQPESYDWLSYISNADSVSEEMTRAWSGIKYVEPRLLAIHKDCQAILKDRKEDLQMYERIYALWIQADEIEIGWVSQSYKGGSQQRAAIPRARLRTLLRRIQALQEMKKNSDLFNQ